MIVRSMGELDLRLFEELAEDEWQPRPDHPAMMSMRYPNETTTMDGFVRSMIKDWLIHDNAYALLTPAAGNQFSISRIPAHMVVVQGDSLFDIEMYRVWPQGAWTTAGAWGGGGTPIDLLPSSVLHWHGEHPHDPRVGLSRLDTLRDVIAEDAALSQAIIELANNGLQAPIWVSRPLDAPEMSHPTLKAHEEDIANRLRGRNRKPPVMVEGEKLESFGTSPQDAQMMEVRKWAVERVSMMYGVPPGLALQDRWASEARLQLIEDVLAPTGKDFTSVFDQRILVRVYDWEQGRFAFNLDEKRMSDDRLAKLVSATGRPVLVTNEARAMFNKPPVPGGDELITPMNVIVGDNPRPSPQVMPVQDANKPAQDGSYRQEDGPTPLPSGGAPSATNARPAANAPAARSAPPAKALKDASSAPDDRLPQFHPRRGADIERQYRHIDTMSAVVQRHYTRLQRHLADREKKAKTGTDWPRWDREFADDINTALTSVVQGEGDVYSMKLGAPHSFDMGRVRNYLKAMAEGAAGAINDTIRSDIDALGLDDAFARAAQHVASAGASLGVRSTVWAREEAARQSPGYDTRVKSWIADTDRHAEFDGETVPIGADWPAGFPPGGAPGCKCSASVS
jgi:HK97 family phage portal protein